MMKLRKCLLILYAALNSSKGLRILPSLLSVITILLELKNSSNPLQSKSILCWLCGLRDIPGNL